MSRKTFSSSACRRNVATDFSSCAACRSISKVKAQLADLGSPALAGSPADFGKLIADETEKWAKVVKFIGIKAD